MDEATLLNAIDHYRLSTTDRALLLNGEWGSGKTFFIKKHLLNDDDKYIYLSAFGLKNSEELDRAIIFRLPRRAKGATQRLFLRLIMPVKEIIAQIKIMGFKMPDSLLSASTILNTCFSSFKKYLIIIDDIERSSIPLRDLLGKISTYTETYGFKVLLVSNVKEFKDEDAQLFESYRDKIISEELHLKLDYEQIITTLIDETSNNDIRKVLQSNRDSICDFVKAFELSNIRQMRSGTEKASEVLSILLKRPSYKKHPEYSSLITDIILFSLYDSSGLKDYHVEYNQDIQTIRLSSRREGPYNIRYFSFIADYGPLDLRARSEEIEQLLSKHLHALIKSRQAKNDPVMALYDSSYRLEDEEIIEKEEKIINKLKTNAYKYEYYPRIILVLIRCKNIMGDNSYLTKAKGYMAANINTLAIEDYDFIDLATFTYFDEQEVNEFRYEMNSLRELIVQSKSKKTFSAINASLTKIGWSEKFKKVVFEHNNEIASEKRFFSSIDVDKLMQRLKDKHTNTQDYCNIRDAITGIYGKLKEYPDLFYKHDYEALKDFYERFIQLEPKSRTSMLIFNYIKGDLTSYIEILDTYNKHLG